MKQVRIETNHGNFIVELNEEKAPKTVANFLAYVERGHYTNTIFHRVIDGFMIQGGGFEPGMKQKPAENTVENEANNGLNNDKYTISMARTSAPHSASVQFFINVKDNNFLNYPGTDGWGYAVFGKVIEGFDVVDAIKGVKTTRNGMFADVPQVDVVINRVVLIQADEIVTDPEVAKKFVFKTYDGLKAGDITGSFPLNLYDEKNDKVVEKSEDKID